MRRSPNNSLFIHVFSVIITVLIIISVMNIALAASPQEPQEKAKTINIDMVNADAVSLLRLIAGLGGFNLIADGNIRGNITVSFKDLTAEQALDILTITYGWSWKRVGSTIVVADAQKLKDAFEPKSLAVIQLKYADPKTLNDILGLVLASDKVRVDTRTNQVIIYGSQDEVTRAKQFIDSVDVPIQQVAILTRIEEISSDGLKDLGIEWSFPSLQVSFQQGSMGISLDYETGLKALEEKDLATTLARPGITTLDGNEASIMLGDRVPVKEEITVDNKTTTTVEFIDVGVKLKFLPRVNKDGRITVKMSPEISSITGKSADGYPQISTRNVETVINIRNGETVAIGGLLQHQEIENISKIPLLGSIPLVGTLFSTKKKDIKDSEVVIFVTTYLINPEETVNLYKTMPETVKTPIPADKNAEGQANEVHASKQ